MSYDSEQTVDRGAAAAVLSGVTDGILAGAVELGDGDEAVSVAIPEEVDLEVELETENGETSLEVELAWDEADAGPARGETETGADAAAAAGDGPPETADETGTADGTDREDATATADRPVDPPVPVGAATPVESLARFELFQDRAAEWRWRLRHRNGNIIATGGEGYTQKHNARKGLQSVVGNAPGAEVVDESLE
jgi:amphi-Trp domain-containing protein